MALREFLVVAWTLGAPVVAAEAPGRNLLLHVGETQEVQFPIGTDLTVSRRGVVELFHVEGSTWQITGLHSGFVVIDGRDPTTGEGRPPRLFVDVSTPSDKEAADRAVALPPTWPDWLCHSKAIRCDTDAAIITGTLDDHLRYLRAHAVCRATRNCQFAVELTAAAKSRWMDQLRRQVDGRFLVSVTAAGLPVLSTACKTTRREQIEGEIDALTDGELAAGLLTWRCLEDTRGPAYRLAAKIFLVESSAADELGFEDRSQVEARGPPIATDLRLLSRLKALALERRAEILGQPNFRLTAGQEAELVNGGEFQVLEHSVRDGSDRELATWKQHGLAFKLTVVPLAAGRARLTYNLTLKSRVADAETALTVNSLKSEVELALGAPLLVGILDLEASADHQQSTPPFSHLPLIGPLFSTKGQQNSKSKLCLWLYLEEDPDDAPLVPTGPPRASG